jgi:hypothetical protein
VSCMCSLCYNHSLKQYHIGFVVSIVHNDGVWQMVQWSPCGVHYHIKLQVMWLGPVDGCIKQKLVDG